MTGKYLTPIEEKLKRYGKSYLILKKPLSHAGLVKLYIEKKYPAVLDPAKFSGKLF